MWSADLNNGNYRNPIIYADYSDPDVIRVEDNYYMIASSFCNAPAIPLLHSKDLVNWRIVNYVLDSIPEFRYRNPIHGCGVWAPSIRYHKGVYYVCFPMPDEGIYMTTTTDPYGKWSKPVNIRPGAGWIDPCPFWDDDGKAYLVAGVAKSRIGYKSVLHAVEMQPDGMGLTGEEKVIFDGNLNDQVTIEGPKVYKKDGWYYIFAPAGGVKQGWQTVLRSRSIWGPYEYKVVMRQGDTEINGPHQGAWIDTVTGEDWFIHFQDVYAAGRICHLQPMHWENEWPVIGVNKPGCDYGEPVLEYRKPDIGKSAEELKDRTVYPVGALPATDDFKNGLGLQWQWNANYDESWFSTDNGQLRLNAVATTPLRPLGDVRNLLLQKWPAPELMVVTKMNLDGLICGDTAGYISLGMEYAAVTVTCTDEGYTVNSVVGSQTFDCDTAYTKETVTAVKELSETDFDNAEKSIWFKYIVKRTGMEIRSEMNVPVKAPTEEISIEYAIDGEHYEPVVTIPSKAGRWVGVKSGVFCIHNSDIGHDMSGYVTVDYVKYKNI